MMCCGSLQACLPAGLAARTATLDALNQTPRTPTHPTTHPAPLPAQLISFLDIPVELTATYANLVTHLAGACHHALEDEAQFTAEVRRVLGALRAWCSRAGTFAQASPRSLTLPTPASHLLSQRAVTFFESWARQPLHVDDLHLQLGVRDTFFLDPALSLSPGQTARLLVAYAALKHRYGWTQHK